MTIKRLYTVLGVEAGLCALFALWFGWSDRIFLALLSFPFLQIGGGLRALSLSGAGGNAAAIVLYVCLCLWPLIWLIWRAVRGRARGEDTLLALLCAVLFPAFYMLINPAGLYRHFGPHFTGGLFGAGQTGEAFGAALLGVTLYSIFAAYAVLRALRAFPHGGTQTLLRYLRYLMAVICAALVFSVCGLGLGTAATAWRDANVDTGLLILLRYLIQHLPHVVEFFVVAAAFALAAALEREPYSGEAVAAAQKMGRRCRAAAAAIVLSQVGVNLLQLLAGAGLATVSYDVSLPLTDLVFVLAALLLARYFEQARQLKDDNDLFI